eukprot:152025_1
MDPNTPPNDKQPPLSDPQNVAGAMTPEFSPGGDLPVSGLNDGQHDDGFPKMDAEQSMTGFAANDFFENDQYTMKFLTVKGVRFEVHYLLMVVAFSGFDILFEARGRGIHVYSRVLMVPIVAVGMVFSVLGHELAHIIVMMGSGYMFEKAILLPLGGTVCLRVEASRLTQVMVAAAGPAFNVVLAVVCALLGKVFGTDDFVGNSFKIISAFNVSMAYWNLTMPVHPLYFSSITTANAESGFSRPVQGRDFGRRDPGCSPAADESLNVHSTASQQRCCLCESVRDMLDFEEYCFTMTDVFSSLLDPKESDFRDAKSSCGRLDKVKPVPSSLVDCNNVQKRIVLYYKIFRHVWTDVFTRNNIPLCIC